MDKVNSRKRNVGGKVSNILIPENTTLAKLVAGLRL